MIHLLVLVSLVATVRESSAQCDAVQFAEHLYRICAEQMRLAWIRPSRARLTGVIPNYYHGDNPDTPGNGSYFHLKHTILTVFFRTSPTYTLTPTLPGMEPVFFLFSYLDFSWESENILSGGVSP